VDGKELKGIIMKDDIVIIDGARTAIGSFGGSLKSFEAYDLGAIAIRGLMEKLKVDPQIIDEVIMGCVAQAAENTLLARISALKAGLPDTSTALTINRACSSGLQSIVTAAMEINTGFSEVVIAGGAESMNNVPFYLRKARYGYRMGHGRLEDGLIISLTDPLLGIHMGITAENIAEKFNISRQQQDEYSLLSQRRAVKAISEGLFKDEIVPITIKEGKDKERIFDTDEYPRFDSDLEKLAKLKPAFKEDGTVTPGNASGINDAGCAVLVMGSSKASQLGLKPKAKYIDAAAAGVPPEIMGTGPVPAVKKLLKKTGLSIGDIGLFEINEAFAVQALYCINELGIDMDRVNVNGSGISLGHPVGATGAIITIKLINEMIRRNVRYGISTLCIGGGQGLAALFELA
jgi:acetyl-CoA C-acetyltransferase